MTDLIWKYKTYEELTKDELYDCLALRVKVFVIEQDCPYQEVDGKDRQSDHFFGVDADEKIVAYARIPHPGVSYQELSMGRIVVDPSIRGKAIGKELMVKAMNELKKKWGNVAIRISAQQHLKLFYEHFGFLQVSEMYLEDDIPHIEMLYTPKTN
ncbi:GNAT family N-acetyltransferase [Halocola ammonii]